MNIAVQRMSTYFLPKNYKTFVINKQVVSLILLLLLVFLSALGVVYIQAKNRNLFVELQALQKTRDSLNVEWGQLILEQNTWSAQSRVGEIAQQELNMEVPAQKDITLITR